MSIFLVGLAFLDVSPSQTQFVGKYNDGYECRIIIEKHELNRPNIHNYLFSECRRQTDQSRPSVSDED